MIFDRLAVIGLGLVGGSVALAARSRGVAREVRGVDPGLESAGDLELVSLEAAAAWADGIVLAVPIGSMEETLRALGDHVRPDALLTDTASVKGPVAAAARAYLRAPEHCVGAHPMAGGDVSGFSHARADLFEGAACILTPAGTEPPGVVDRIEQFWQCLGTFTVRRTPEEHDAITAVLSHAPHVIAYAFARGLPDEETLGLAGRGLRDFIRIARANPRLWSEILLRNRQKVAEEVAKFEKNLGEILEAIGRGDREALERILDQGRRSLARLRR